MVRIDVDDKHVVELALLRLLARVGEQPGGVELFDRNASAAVGDEVHGAPPDNDVESDRANLMPVASSAKAGLPQQQRAILQAVAPRGTIRFG
jgi:hypothetical protein